MKDADITTAGGRIREARVNCRLTMRELADRVGISPNYLSAVERNDKKQASSSLIQKIADATGVSSEWLRTGAYAVTEKASCANDVPLLLTLIMQQGNITKETVATVLAVDIKTVDGILSGKVCYNPRWENGLLNLVQRLDLTSVQKKLQNLVLLFQQENEKKTYLTLLWTLQKYLTDEYKVGFRAESQPVLVLDNPSYVLFELKCGDKPEMWSIRYYSSACEENFEDILNQSEVEDSNITVAVAVPDKDTYEKMICFYNNIQHEIDTMDAGYGARGESFDCEALLLPSIKLLYIVGETVEGVTDLVIDPPPSYWG